MPLKKIKKSSVHQPLACDNWSSTLYSEVNGKHCTLLLSVWVLFHLLQDSVIHLPLVLISCTEDWIPHLNTCIWETVFKKNQIYVFGWGWGNVMHLCNHVMFGDGKNRIALQNLIYFYAYFLLYSTYITGITFESKFFLVISLPNFLFSARQTRSFPR